MEPAYTYINDAPKNIYEDTLRAIRDIIDPTQAMSREGLVQLCRVLQSDSERYHRRVRLFQRVQRYMRDPERTLVCDILANGQLLPDPTGTRYGFPATGNEHHLLVADETLPEPAAVTTARARLERDPRYWPIAGKAQPDPRLHVTRELEVDASAAAVKEAPTSGWQPIATAPKDGTWVLLAGPSGYKATPLRAEVCRYYPEYRPLDPWQNHSNDAFSDGGAPPTHWQPLAPLPLV